MSRMPMADDEGQIIANWPTTQVSPAVDSNDNNIRPLVCSGQKISKTLVHC